MSTIEDIEYDTAKLREMSTKELTYQLCCREDLKQPKRPFLLDAKNLFQKVVADLQAVADGLRENEFTAPFADAIDEKLAEIVKAREDAGVMV